MEITSKTNIKVKQWMKYHQKKYRDQDKKFIIEGEHLIEEALNASVLDILLVRKGVESPFFNVKEIFEVSDDVMDKLSTNISKVDFIGICHYIENNIDQYDHVLLLDDVQDPGNMGTIIRTAYSFGYQVIFVSKNCVDIYNDKSIRSTQGALFHIPVVQVDLKDQITELQSQKFAVIGTSLQNAKALREVQIPEKCALLFGNEGQGVHPELMTLCDTNICIEMHAFESLNVAIAAGICMYQFAKR